MRIIMEPENMKISNESEGKSLFEPQKPTIIVTVAGDRMTAEILLKSALFETINPEAGDIMAELGIEGIVQGIDIGLIEQLERQPIYDKSFVIARGKAAGTGKDGYLKYLLDTDRDLKPVQREDGTMDYRDLGYVKNVRKGQALCEVHPATKGKDGFDVYGNVLEGAWGENPADPVGLNTEFDKEKGMVIAMVDGNAEVTPKGIINISDVLKINGSVDNSTGNINFVGDVIVNGDVASGFKIVADGSIQVKGNVQGAFLTAKRDIVVGGGVNGMDSARLEADGSIKCKYIQNCYLRAKENIYADSIMYCTTECNGDIELTGKRGALIGGKSTVVGQLSAKTIGTDLHVATQIIMTPVGLNANETILELNKDIKALDREESSLKQLTARLAEVLAKIGTLPPNQASAFLQARIRLPNVNLEREAKRQELSRIQDEQLNADPTKNCIKCSGRLHAGVKITFGSRVTHVQESSVNSRIYVSDGDIKFSPL